MSEDTPELGSLLPYIIASFLLIQLWGFMAYETAQFQLLSAYERPLTWIFWGAVILLVMIPPVALLSWWMKRRTDLDLDWEFRDREVVLDEYGEMMREYKRNYLHFISYWDWRLISATLILALSALFIPILLLHTNWVGIAASPFIFGALVVFFGLVLIVTLYGGVSNGVSPEFPVYSLRKISRSVNDLRSIAGISWYGVRITVGESQGLYTMRNPRPVAHVEGIEGVAWVEGVTEDSSNPELIHAVIENKNGTRELVGNSIELSDTLGVTQLVRSLLDAYIADRGENELLEDVIEEIDASINHLKQSMTSK